MNPNQQQPPTYSIDYLNQIAPVAQKKQMPDRKIIIIAALLALTLITIIISVIVSFASPKASLDTLAARLESTATIASNSQQTLKSTPLRTLNSNLTIYLKNTNRDITALGVLTKKIDESILLQESATDITKRLEDARLNAVFDRTYAREMSYRLETILLLMQRLQRSASSQSHKTFLKNSYDNLLPTQKQFADFNAANG